MWGSSSKAAKESLDGQPKNGMFIAVPSELKSCVRKVSPHHDRVQAIVLSMAAKILIINSYFPTDPKTQDFDTTELCSTLAAIKSVLEENEFEDLFIDLEDLDGRKTADTRCLGIYLEIAYSEEQTHNKTQVLNLNIHLM